MVSGDKMNLYNLNVSSNNVGGYFSSEQLELLSIIQCQTYEDVVIFVYQCKQLNGVFTHDDLKNFVNQDLEQLKRFVFKSYQDTLVPHNSNKEVVLNNTLYRLGLSEEEINVIKRAYSQGKSPETIKYISGYIQLRYPNNYEEIIKQVHRFISTERDQNKNSDLYDELVLVNNNLAMFDTLLIGSGKPEIVINNLLSDDNKDKFDFYFAERDLDFALKNNKHVRLHSFLTKNACEQLFVGNTKIEILQTLTDYVKASVDFVNNYNSTHRLKDGTPVINAIDLFNELISFDKNEKGGYENIWETKYGITIEDICGVFSYAREHKPDRVSYLYNEPFLEDTERRKKVIEILQQINSTSNGLIDTLGSQTHITFRTSNEQIQSCFNDFKALQETHGLNVQITEFDLSLGESETLRTIGDNPEFSYEQVYDIKKQRLGEISSIINNSGVRLSGISYWSLTDKIDCNLERVRTNLLNKGIITNIHQVPTVCGGLMPTSSQYAISTQKHTSEILS